MWLWHSLIVAIGWLAVISPQRSSTNSLRGEADAALAQNTALAAKVAKLKRQNDNVGELKVTLRAALAALPFDTGLPTFTRQVADQATRSKVTLTSISIGAVSATAGPPAPAPTTGTPAQPAPAPPRPALAPAVPAHGTPAPTVVAIPVTLLSKGTNAHQLAFLKAIQVAGPRRALVSSTTLGTAGRGRCRFVHRQGRHYDDPAHAYSRLRSTPRGGRNWQSS